MSQHLYLVHGVLICFDAIGVLKEVSQAKLIVILLFQLLVSHDLDVFSELQVTAG